MTCRESSTVNPNGILAQSPGLRVRELPWEIDGLRHNPNGVAARLDGEDTTPLGLERVSHLTQGSSCLATLGWRTQSLWDCTAGPAKQAVHSAGRRGHSDSPGAVDTNDCSPQHRARKSGAVNLWMCLSSSSRNAFSISSELK